MNLISKVYHDVFNEILYPKRTCEPQIKLLYEYMELMGWFLTIKLWMNSLDDAVLLPIKEKIDKAVEIRKYWIEFFREKFSSPCKNCWGDCCKTHYAHFMRRELWMIFLRQPAFDLPSPDIVFLQKRLSEDKTPCIMLGRNGCLLGDERPLTCLMYICKKMRTHGLSSSENEQHERDEASLVQLTNKIQWYLSEQLMPGLKASEIELFERLKPSYYPGYPDILN